MINRRSVLGSLAGVTMVATAGCSRSRSAGSLSLGLIRVVNLKDASLDVQLTLTPRGDETKVQQDDTLAEKGSGGGAEADQLIYRPDSRPEVSDYDYALTIDGELEHDITGPKIVGSVTREFDSDACLVLHYIVNEPDVTVAYSHELYPACDLPE